MSLFPAFVRFSREALRTGDFDPNYLLLRAVFDAREYPPRQRLDHIYCFLGTSHIASGEKIAARLLRDGKIGDTTADVKNTQRRAFRGNNNMAAFFEGTRGLSYSRIRLIVDTFGPERAWGELRKEFEQIPFAGPYHSYKFCDLLKYCLDIRITAPDIGVGGGGKNAGPIPGLQRLTGRNWRECASSRQLQDSVYFSAKRAGVPYPGREEFETCLCDFDKWAKGRYYIGENLDSQMLFLKDLDPVYWECRRKVFSPEVLGEIGGWEGPRKERRGVPV